MHPSETHVLASSHGAIRGRVRLNFGALEVGNARRFATDNRKRTAAFAFAVVFTIAFAIVLQALEDLVGLLVVFLVVKRQRARRVDQQRECFGELPTPCTQDENKIKSTIAYTRLKQGATRESH